MKNNIKLDIMSAVPLAQSRIVKTYDGNVSIDSRPYVLQCSLNRDATVLAASLSNRSVQFYEPDEMRRASTFTLAEGDNVIRSIEWADHDPNLLLIATTTPDDYVPLGSGHKSIRRDPDSDASAVMLFDIRSGQVVDGVRVGRMRQLRGEVGAASLSTTGFMLAASFGSSIGFFDIRAGLSSHKVLDTYTESHCEHITQLKFHPVLPGHLVSGGEDGLVCVFDTRIKGENDAIMSVLAAGDAISQFGFFGPHGAFAHVLTRTDTLSLWNLGSAERITAYPSLRSQFIEAGLTANSLFSCSWDETNNAISLLASNDDGGMYLFDVNETSVVLNSSEMKGHSAAIRTGVWSKVTDLASQSIGNVIYTGGEDGHIVQWVDAGAHHVLQSNAKSELTTPRPTPVGEHARPSRGKWRRDAAYPRRKVVAGVDDEVSLFGSRIVKRDGDCDDDKGSGSNAGNVRQKMFEKYKNAPF